MSRVEFSADWAPRFWNRVERQSDEDCWLWRGAPNNLGRPSFSVGGRTEARRVSASRYSFWIAGGLLGPTTVVCHSCDNPPCVNPAHLFGGTQADNLADMTAKGRRARSGPVGERNGNSKVTDEQARSISTRLAAGESPTHLGREFGVGRSAIYRIAKRAVQ